jgi:hypothetical protein
MEAPGTTDRSRARLRQELKRLGGRGDGIADQQRDDRADCDTQRTDQRGHTDDEGAGREQREGDRRGDRQVVPLQHPEPSLRTEVSVVRQSPIPSIGSTGGNGSPCRKATSCVIEAIADTSISATSFASGPP